MRLKPGASFTWCPSSTSPAVQEALSPSGAPVALPGGDDKDVSSASEKTPHLLHFPKKIINGEANQKPDKSTQIKHNDSRLKWMEAFETNSWSFPGFLFTLQRPGLPPGGMRRLLCACTPLDPTPPHSTLSLPFGLSFLFFSAPFLHCLRVWGNPANARV